MMRRRFVRHPLGYAGYRPIGLWNYDQLSTTVGVLPDNEHGLAAPGMKRIVNPPLDRMLAGSMSLLRAAPRPSPGQALDDADIGLLFQKMGGKAVPQRVNTDTLGNAGALRGHANEPVELAPTHVLSPVAGEQPGLAGMRPSLLTRGAPPFTQYIEQVGREKDVAILVALALLDADHHSIPAVAGERQRYYLR